MPLVDTAQYFVISKRRAGYALGAALIGLGLAIAFHSLWLPLLAYILMVDEAPQPAGAIVVLGGGMGEREATGARLYAEGYAPIVVTTGGSLPLPGLPDATWASLSQAELERLGVPPEQIVPVDESTSTCEDARDALRALPPGTKRVIIVTDPFHTRRAQWVFEQVGWEVEVIMVAASPSWFDPHRWWTEERGLIVVGQEYVKFGMTLLKGCS